MYVQATGHVTLDMCLPTGEIARNVLSKSNVVHVPALYTALRKTTWGTYIYIYIYLYIYIYVYIYMYIYI
jgi:ribosomal protein RSM22 (predicted rRNA methylase)